MLFVDHLVANQRPASGLVELNIEPFFFVKPERVSHDEGRCAGDGDKADFEVFFLQRSFVLRHRFECAQGKQRGNGSACGVGTDRFEKAAANTVYRKQRLDQAGFHEALRERLLAGGCSVVFARGVRLSAGAAQHQWAVGIIGIKTTGHVKPLW